MKRRIVTVLPGDGIGLEVIPAGKLVIERALPTIRWDEQVFGNGLFPSETLAALKRTGIGYKGPTRTPPKGHGSINVRARIELGLEANIRPFRNDLPGIRTRWSDTNVDIVVIRQATEDLYVGLEHRIENGEGGEALSRITKAASRRIAKVAFDYARKHLRTRVTVMHKANVLKITHGEMWLDVIREVAKDYPDVVLDDQLFADAVQMNLVANPDRYDIILAPNLFGDMVSDLCAAMIGKLGFAPGANIGTDCAIFEPVHGSADDIAGSGIANPIAAIHSGALMLEHLNEHRAAEAVRRAVKEALEAGFGTPDVSPKVVLSTMGFAKEIADRIRL